MSRSVVSYLDGRDEALYELLWRGLEDAAASSISSERRDSGKNC